MAMSSSSIPVNNTTLENLVKCAICLDYYNDPRCLPCSHTYCYQCIEKLCEDGIGRCPMRDNSIFFLHAIDQLPVNRIAKDLVECIQKSSSAEIKCDHCQQILSEFFCETCSKNYCTTCLKLEHTVHLFQAHEMNIMTNQNQNFSHFCPEHAEEKQKYWCNSCQELVCSDCLLFQHKEHSFLPIKDISAQNKIEFHSSMQLMSEMKSNLQKLTANLTAAYRNHYQTHFQTKTRIEQIFNDLKEILEKRKKNLIQTITLRDSHQQKLLQEQRNNLEEYIKTIFIRELFTKELLNMDDHFKLVEMKKDFLIYNQLIHQQYQSLIQGSVFDLQHLNLDQDLAIIHQQFQDLGTISTDTFATDMNGIHPLIKLSSREGDEILQQLQGNYAYGYRFHLTKPLQIQTVRVKVALFDADLTVYILDHNDILSQKETLKKTDQNCSKFEWVTIPIHCRMEHNSYIFIWAQPNEDSVPLIASKQSNYNLREINDYLSVRSKRAGINPSRDIGLNTKFNVIYDAFDEKDRNTPAIEMILDL